MGLLVNLERRIGGVRAGSGGYVWQITDAANKLLAQHLGEEHRGRRRPSEPSTTFLDHTLAVAEVVITLQESSHDDIVIEHLQLEPDCSRTFIGAAGEPRTLRPDLRSTSRSGGFTEVFPAVVWVVPHARRYEQLRRRLAADPEIDQRLFTVIQLDQIGELLRLGADEFKQRTGGQEGGEPS